MTGPSLAATPELPASSATSYRRGSELQAGDLALNRAKIDQATGMLTEQLGTGTAGAFIRLRAYAFVNDLRLTDVARDIVAGRLRLYPTLPRTVGH
jgi:hypothetical protein